MIVELMSFSHIYERKEYFYETDGDDVQGSTDCSGMRMHSSRSFHDPQSEARRHEMEAVSAKDLVETLKKTIDQLSQSQTHLATQLGQSANRSMDGYERTKQLWEEEKRELTTAINRLEKDLVKKLPETTLLSKKIQELEVRRIYGVALVNLGNDQTEKKSLVERVTHAEVELESGKAQPVAALPRLPESAAGPAIEPSTSKPRSKKMDAEVEKQSVLKMRTKKAEAEVESLAPKARLAKVNIAVEPVMESDGEDFDDEPAPKSKGRKKNVTAEVEVPKKLDEVMPVKRNTKRKSTVKPKTVPESPMDTEEPAFEGPTENESPNKKSPSAAKKRRKVTAQPPIPEPPKADNLPMMSLAAKLKERSASAASSSSCSSKVCQYRNISISFAIVLCSRDQRYHQPCGPATDQGRVLIAQIEEAITLCSVILVVKM